MLAPQKIRVNSIAPGAIKTDINKSVWGDEAKLKTLLDMIPYGRIGEPGDIAKVALWLVSDDADYITGTTIYADGGMMLYPNFMHGG
jgi:glucose 1-dehydrogenase